MFYLVVDHKSDEHSQFTGVHLFDLRGSRGAEVSLSDGNTNFINIAYDPDYDGTDWRDYELEGLTVVDYMGFGQLHVIMLQNDIDDDDVYIDHFAINNLH